MDVFLRQSHARLHGVFGGRDGHAVLDYGHQSGSLGGDRNGSLRFAEHCCC
jgi:hypothetical protein